MGEDKRYNAVIVLGSGIREDGSLPNSSKACVKKAVKLYKNNQVSHIIFSGKWSYKLNYTPLLTEAKAMARHALTLGITEKDFLIEDDSITTVSNLCNVKENILEKKGWRKIILISIKPQDKRALYNLKKVLGNNYHCKIVTADFSYPPEKLKELQEIERKKIQDAIRFYKGIQDGDHRKIHQLAMKDLEENYIEKSPE